MSQARVEQGRNGRLEIHGDLNSASVARLWREASAWLPAREQLEVDLSHVARSDSAGLALLVECLRRARQTGATIRFFNIPAQMLAIARVSALDEVLPLERD
ncbi:MAG: STAS domain-containing protein [Gammaproteobacteria bacterium]|jgi:phospholipid transport system transporter-binding protein